MTVHTRTWRIGSAVLVVLSLLLVFLIPRYAFAADAVVGDGTPESCTETTFNTALQSVQDTGGGTVSFNCGTDPLTIDISAYKRISSTVTIDGGDLITFDGGGTAAFFQVYFDAALTLEHITAQNGVVADVHPLENFGILTLNTVTLLNNGGNGSAVVNYGTLSVTNSTFTDNTVTEGTNPRGAAISNENSDAYAYIETSVFANNAVSGTGGVGGAISNLNGTIVLSDTELTGNHASDSGGAISNLNGTITFNGTELTGNDATASGGAIYASPNSTTTITASTLSQNSANGGGAIASVGVISITQSTLSENHATTSGGAIQMTAPPAPGKMQGLPLSVDIADSQFSNNTAGGFGGALFCSSGFFSILRSTFNGNQSGSDGGAIYSTCMGEIYNSTLTENTATGGGGGIFQDVQNELYAAYLTVANNTADYGAGIYNNGLENSTLSIGWSIVAYNSTGNCDGVITSNGYNLTNDTGCGAFTEEGDVIEADVPLSPLGNYGGYTQTLLPLPASSALDHIPNSACANETDQRGVQRPQGTDCDSGAVERTEGDGNGSTPTPTVTPPSGTPTPTATPNPNLTEKLYLPLITTAD